MLGTLNCLSLRLCGELQKPLLLETAVPDLSPPDKAQALCLGLDHSHNLNGMKFLLEIKEVG